MKKLFGFLILSLLLSAPLRAERFEPEISTAPLGSPFFRHLAFDYNLDIRDLVRLERRGFGRGESVALVLIAKSTTTTVRELARRRLRDKTSLADLAKEMNLDYPTLRRNVEAIKEGIEAKGDQNLPAPVFEPTPTPAPPKKKKRKKGDPEPSPSPSPSSSPAPDASPAATPAPSATPL